MAAAWLDPAMKSPGSRTDDRSYPASIGMPGRRGKVTAVKRFRQPASIGRCDDLAARSSARLATDYEAEAQPEALVVVVDLGPPVMRVEIDNGSRRELSQPKGSDAGFQFCSEHEREKAARHATTVTRRLQPIPRAWPPPLARACQDVARRSCSRARAALAAK